MTLSPAKIGLVTLCLLLESSRSQGAGSWTSLAPLPTSNYAAGAAFVNNQLYCFGGFATTALQIYNPGTNTWGTGAGLAELRQYMGVAVNGTDVYIVGGDTGGGGWRNTLWRYDTVGNTWNFSLPVMPGGARYNNAAALVAGKIYSMGGNAGGPALTINEAYDIGSNTWITRTAMPTARAAHALVVYNGLIYAIGGGTLNLDIYDPVTDSWSAGPPMPFGANYHASLMQGHIFVFDAGVAQAYDPVSGTWDTAIASMLVNRGNFSQAVDTVGNVLYTFGGWNGSYVNSLEGFTINFPTPTPTPSASPTPVTPIVWSNMATMPTTRMSMAGAEINGKFYVVGGSNFGVAVYHTALEAYDPGLNSWATLAPMPSGRMRLGVAVVNGILYAVGGYNASFGGSMAAMEAYDPILNSWQARAPMPTAKNAGNAAAVNGKVYAMGGDDTLMYAYDPAANTWSSKASMPSTRGYFGVVEYNGILYAIGGANGPTFLDNVDAYDPVADTWTAKAPMPTPRAYIGIAVQNGRIYVMGGSISNSAYGTVESYDPLSNTWRVETPLNVPRWDPVAAAVGGNLYVVGGNDGGAGQDRNTNERGALPFMSPTPSPTYSQTPALSATVTPTFSQSASPSSTPSVTLTLSPTVTLTFTPTITATLTPTTSFSVTTSPTVTHSSTPSPVATATTTQTPPATPTVTPTFSASPTNAPTAIPPTPVNSPTPDPGVIFIPNLKNYRGGELVIQIKGAAPGPSGISALTHLPGGGVVVLDNLGTSLSNGTTVIRWSPSNFVAPGTPFTLRLTDSTGKLYTKTFVYVE